MDLVKILAAFCLGGAVLAGLQSAYVWSIQRHLKSEHAKAGMPPIGKAVVAPKFDPGTIKAIVPSYGRIDTREAQRRGVESAQRRIDMQIRAAQNAVPLPPRIYIPRR
jgi:hypothetical protein